MKLNPDCIRDIMLVLEEKLSVCDSPKGYYFQSSSVPGIISCVHEKGYSKEEVAYTVLQLAESGYIVTSSRDLCNITHHTFNPGSILYITPKGHEFIAKIRDTERWRKVKSGVSIIRDYSLSAIASIAEGITSAAISAFFSGQKNLQ